jgi:hypothetical protein
MDEDEIALEVREEVRALPMVTRDMIIRAESFDEGANTVEVVFTTGARGARFDWNRYAMIDEELATEAGNVRLERLNGGAPVLNTHNSYELDAQIGVVVDGSARMSGGQGVATLRLSRRKNLAAIVADIRDGIIRNISVGYVVHTYEITETEGQRALYRAVDWEPYEISFVPMPFDAGAQTRSLEPAQGGHPCIIRRAIPATQETIMDEDEIVVVPGTVPAPTPRAPNPAPAPDLSPTAPGMANLASIRTAVRNAGLTDEAAFEIAATHEATPLTRDALMAEIGRRFAERDTPAPSISRAPAQVSTGVTMVRAMEDALFHRMVPQADLSEAGRQFRSFSLLRMAEEMLSSSGINCRGMAPIEIAERALHTTSDFPALMASTLNRRLRSAYEENVPSYRRWARRAPNAPDFRSIEVVQFSAMPDLLKVNEAGEFKYGTASDGKINYAVSTFGRIIGVSRQTLVNDDLRALERITTGFAGSAARLENRTVYSLLTANAAMPYDNAALFHANHGNLGTAAAIGVPALSEGRKNMRLQKGLQNEELNLAPSYLLVPATQEHLAYQFTSSQYVPAKSTDVNEFRAGGRTSIEPIVEALLDANSATSWYLAAGNETVDTVEYAYLDGAEGVQMGSRIGFNVDGVEIKASLDFAAAVVDHRGLSKNPGL